MIPISEVTLKILTKINEQKSLAAEAFAEEAIEACTNCPTHRNGGYGYAPCCDACPYFNVAVTAPEGRGWL